ncbi:excalibur calcium-binding domain-containing protein [Qipengyuania gelatinilytica]|uniref:excalibur calcium-binding domain-containing protein n=1 Tax=Qipengyuania gelatinilytica TaxID=2867231 RepID=UPI001FFCC18D|nr:excalibur calcium-binding domain-containing protein [Qipengyuania gelatinilytica]
MLSVLRTGNVAFKRPVYLAFKRNWKASAPVRIGDPGYGRHLDRDNDGIGCE